MMKIFEWEIWKQNNLTKEKAVLIKTVIYPNKNLANFVVGCLKIDDSPYSSFTYKIKKVVKHD